MADPGMTEFERRLERRLLDHASLPVRPVDADGIARQVVRTRRGPRLPLGPAWPVRFPGPLAWTAVALLLAGAIIGGLLAGAVIRRDPLAQQPIVIALEDGLYLAGEKGADRRLVRDDGSFISPRWSPAGDRIAVLHGPRIAPQAGADAPPGSASEYRLQPAELLVLDRSGRTVVTVAGPIRDFAWAPGRRDGRALLAVGTAAGRVLVLDPGGSVVGEARREAERVSLDEQVLGPPGLAWTPSGDLLFTSGRRVMGLRVGSATAWRPGDVPRAVEVATTNLARINALAVSPDGASLAFIAADCVTNCAGDAYAVPLPLLDGVAGEISPVAFREPAAVRSGVRASTRLDWSADSRTILAWPLTITVRDGSVRRVSSGTTLDAQEPIAGWARWAPDRSGRIVVLTLYSYFNDRHFDAWLADAGGTVTRIGVRSLGFDVLASGN